MKEMSFWPKTRSTSRPRLYGSTSFFAVLLCASSAAHAAAPVTLTFSGMYDTQGTTVGGLTGSAVPFSYQITYDPALDTNTWFFPAGSTLDGATALNDWYGYSASGITASNITFGTQTFTVADLEPRVPQVGVEADLWFDTDISQVAPTRAYAFFFQFPSLSALELGEGVVSGTETGASVEIVNQTRLVDGSAGATDVASFIITSTVPEPGATDLALVAAAGVLSSRRRLMRGRARSAVGG